MRRAMTARRRYIHDVRATLLREGYGGELSADELKFVQRCQDDNAAPHICAHWIELERILAVFDLVEGLIIN